MEMRLSSHVQDLTVPWARVISASRESSLNGVPILSPCGYMDADDVTMLRQ